MSAPGREGRRGWLAVVPPPVLVLLGVVSVQVGAGLAARLFRQIPPAAVTGLRIWAAAVILIAADARGLRVALTGLARRRAWPDALVVVSFGAALAVMNYSIYQAFARIPLGIAVTIEFLGPLAVAVASSRRPRDLLWVGLAGVGVALLTRTGPGTGPGRPQAFATGLAFALLAALSWAAYILLSRATGRRFASTSGLAIAMAVAAVAVTPAAVATGRGALLAPGILLMGLAIGLLSSTIPYSLELETLRRVPARVFGIWMSSQPAVAAMVGLIMLGESLSPREWIAIGCVMVACACAAMSSGEPQPPPA